VRNLQGQGILGGQGFIERIKGMLKGKRLSEGIVGRKRLFGHPTPEEVVSVVSKAFGVKEGKIWERGGEQIRPEGWPSIFVIVTRG